MPESPVREPRPDLSTRSYIHVTLEIWGQRFTSSLGPVSDDEGWAVFQAFLADMKRLKPIS